MFKFFRSNKEQKQPVADNNESFVPEQSSQSEPTPKTGFFKKLYNGLTKTRKQLFGGLTGFLTGKVQIDETLWEELEDHLLLADVGVDLTSEILDELTKEIAYKDTKDIATLKQSLSSKLINILKPCETEFKLDIDRQKGPVVILMVGVNGAGKTTTIGKLAAQYKAQGHSVMLAAGDTFRAAAIEQLVTWGERNNVPVVAQKTGSDSASVIYDAYESAKAKNIDILIADTAGRLHTHGHLMQELAKIKKVLSKQQMPGGQLEVMLILDAGMGQNALQQAKQFSQAVDLTSVTFTKLDGTAKGGIIFAIARQIDIPIRYIGIGEGIEDLQAFNAKDFVHALVGME